MLNLIGVLLTGLMMSGAAPSASAGEAKAQDASPVAIAVHGGAGTINRDDLSAEREAAIRAALESALQAGHSVLGKGGSSLDAVTAAVTVMEDSPLFNAGKGAVFNCAGVNEMDAAIMDGETWRAGAVAGLTHTKNPVLLARLVLEESPHVLLVGEGAESYGKQHGIEMVDPEYFQTEFRLEQLHALQERENVEGCGDGIAALGGFDPLSFGTVGAVALDADGNLAAATSTGGMTNKRFGRVGDVPVIGAGTYADNKTAAISATGHGEYFIRVVAAFRIASRMAFLGETVHEAANAVVMDLLKNMGGGGGVIAIDGEGNIAMPFNTSGMYRGWITVDGEMGTAIYADEKQELKQ
ncbi:MAG TPA: isoaspartyl peptidase/L-asparaginase [Gammaproteobacteria bacterium]